MMPKWIILIFVIIVILVLIVLLSVFLYNQKLDNEFEENRASVKFSDMSEFDKGGDYIHFLNTDSSDAILLQSDNHFALIDAGEDSDNPRGFKELEYDGFEEQVLSYIKAYAADEKGKAHLDFVLGTHAHSDHLGGFDTIISDDAISIDRAYLKKYDESKISAHEVEKWDNKEVYNQMLSALENKNIPVISDMDNTPFMLGNFKITIFNTETFEDEKDIGENDNSLGVLIEKDGTRVFLSGDIDNISGDEDRLAPQIKEVDLLKIGHHSYAKSTGSNWLKTLNPKICIVTNNPEKTDKRTLRRITRVTHAPILITGQEDGIIAKIDDGGVISYFR